MSHVCLRRARARWLSGLAAVLLFPAAVLAEDEIFAIRCATYAEADHAKLAQQAASLLRGVKELRGELVRVESGRRSSTVFYGRYVRTLDLFSKKERFKPDPMPDLRLIRDLSLLRPDDSGNERPVWPFLGATLEATTTKGAASAEWDLANARGYWTWQVAVFYNEGEFRERRQAAEAYCKELREKGEEAYFHHGSVRSSVTIGLFPKQALDVVEERNPLTGAKGVKVIPVDPRMAEIEKRHPHNLENGRPMYTITRRPDGSVLERTANRSFAARVPGGE